MRTAPGALSPLATETHALIEQILRTVDGAKDFETDVAWAAEQIDAIRARLAPHARLVGLNLGRPADPPAGRPFYVSGVLGGPHHPMTMPIDLATSEGITTGRVNLDIAWEGPPGCVHGGYVAHLLDCIMGQHNLNVGIPGMTGTLTIRYRQPTPLCTNLRFEVRTDERVGRKIASKAEIWAGKALCAEADGIFIVPARPLGDAPGWDED
ncbi:MAG: PaaI family thioesterase [Candidatus Binatia bacterium]|nr:PaaI family thioesterase [Candidatus Binatia bacterium]